MQAHLLLIEVLAGSALLLYAYVTARVLCAAQYTWRQKAGQLLLIWLLPLLGVLLVHAFLSVGGEPARRRDARFTPDRGDGPSVGTDGSHGF